MSFGELQQYQSITRIALIKKLMILCYLLQHRKHCEQRNCPHEVFEAKKVVKDIGSVDVSKEDIEDVVLPTDDVHRDKETKKLEKKNHSAFVGPWGKYCFE